jgi:hypothetical protein
MLNGAPSRNTLPNGARSSFAMFKAFLFDTPHPGFTHVEMKGNLTSPLPGITGSQNFKSAFFRIDHVRPPVSKMEGHYINQSSTMALH